MKKGGTGGARTQTGLRFEQRGGLGAALGALPGYRVEGAHVFCGGREVGLVLPKHALYREFLEPRGVDWRSILSKKLLPDDALLVHDTTTLFILEKKYQETEGSVDEKLQTCDFKRRQYEKLVKPLGMKVQYTYVLNSWFTDPSYRDVLEYVEAVGCRFYFDEVPLTELGLPAPQG